MEIGHSRPIDLEVDFHPALLTGQPVAMERDPLLARLFAAWLLTFRVWPVDSDFVVAVA